MKRIAAHLRRHRRVPSRRRRLTVERFQMVGAFLGGNTRVDGLHYLLEGAFTDTPDGPRLSDTFLEQVQGKCSRRAIRSMP